MEVLISMKFSVFLPKITEKKSKVINILTEKYKNKNEDPYFEQDYYSQTANGIYNIGQDSN